MAPARRAQDGLSAPVLPLPCCACNTKMQGWLCKAGTELMAGPVCPHPRGEAPVSLGHSGTRPSSEVLLLALMRRKQCKDRSHRPDRVLSDSGVTLRPNPRLSVPATFPRWHHRQQCPIMGPSPALWPRGEGHTGSSPPLPIPPPPTAQLPCCAPQQFITKTLSL